MRGGKSRAAAASVVGLLVLLLSKCAAQEGTDCQALGFTGLALCSDCDALAQHVKDTELEADCRRCCTAEAATHAQTYASAVLEVCMRRVAFFSQVAAFLQEKAPRHKHLTVRYRAHSPPKLLMKDAEGQVQDTVMIDSWRLEHIEAFLQEKLQASE